LEDYLTTVTCTFNGINMTKIKMKLLQSDIATDPN